MSTAKGTTGKRAGDHAGSERRRGAPVTQAAGAGRERRRRRLQSAVVVLTVLAVAAVVAVLVVRSSDDGSASTASSASSGGPVVGGDLHTVFALDDALYVGGHAQAAVSRDQGGTWQDVPGLAGADAMGWAGSGETVLVGGHPGLFRSVDAGTSFERLSGSSAVPDVHALGGSGDVVYVASTQAGVLASTDGGLTWQVRNAEAGQSFMGTILVDPKDPDRLIAPDMAGALATSNDGGRTWSALGGPMGAMAITWNPTDTDQILATGMQGAQRSTDGGATWAPVQLPAGTTALSYSPDGTALYAGVLSGVQAVVHRSTDDGESWQPVA